MADATIDSTTLDSMDTKTDPIIPYLRDSDTPTIGQRENRWVNQDWTKYFGYYHQIGEIKAAIDARTDWVMGKGFETETDDDKNRLEALTGWGKDSGFNPILRNMLTTMYIGGDAFAEIIWGTNLKPDNIKPLNPGRIVIITDNKGRLKRYEYLDPKLRKSVATFKPQQILHLSHKRLVDECHGMSSLEAVDKIILANNEIFENTVEVYRRHVKPAFIFKVDTDDQTEINTFISQIETAVKKGRNLYIPKGAGVEYEIFAIPPGASLDPIRMREHLTDAYWQAMATPSITVGSGSGLTESNARTVVSVFEQSVKTDQLKIEQDIKAQMHIRINLTPSETLQQEIQATVSKMSAGQEAGFGESEALEQPQALQPLQPLEGVGE